MADITNSGTDLSAGGFQTVTPITLSSSDTLTFSNSPRQRLVLVNGTGGSLTVTFNGDSAANSQVEGFGPVDPTAGLQVTLADNAVTAISLVTRNAYMQGTIAITGGTGITAYLLEN